MAIRIIDRRTLLQGTRLWIPRVFGLLLCLNLCACAARFIFSDTELQKAKTEDAVGTVRVYVSNKMVTVYEREDLNQTVVRREFTERKRGKLHKQKLKRNTSGVIVEEEIKNGAIQLWVTWDAKCGDKGCAYGFVRSEDGRYRLDFLPDRTGFEKPRVYRACTLKRQKMRLEKLRALSDANNVYKLRRKRKRKKHKSVFLEYKKVRDKKKERTTRNEPGV